MVILYQKTVLNAVFKLSDVQRTIRLIAENLQKHIQRLTHAFLTLNTFF